MFKKSRIKFTSKTRIASLFCCGLLSLAGEAFSLDYTRSSINLPSSITAFEITHDLDGDGKLDILVVYQRRLMIFFQSDDGKYSGAPDIEIGANDPIPDTYSAVTVGKISHEGGEQILFLHPKGVDAVNVGGLKSAGTQPIVPSRLITRDLKISPGPILAYVQSAFDINGDGIMEIILPVDGGLEIQESFDRGPYQKKSFIPLDSSTSSLTSLEAEPSLLGSAFFERTRDDNNVKLLPKQNQWYGVQYAVNSRTSEFLMTDYDLNRRFSLLTPSSYYEQDDAGQFNRKSSSIYKNIARATLPHESRNMLVNVPNLVDFNNDKVLDTFSVDVTAAKLSPRTDVSIFLGKQDRTFSSKPQMVLRTRDLAYSDALPMGDINGDGALDLALFHLDFQPSSAQSQLKSYLRRGLEGELRFYLYDKEKNQFPAAPSFRHPVLVNYEIYGARQLFRQQVSINGDMTGSGVPDLTLKTGPQEFSVFGNQDGKGFSSSPIAKISTAPTPFSSLTTRDINGDGKSDVVISGYIEGQDDRVIYSVFVAK